MMPLTPYLSLLVLNTRYASVGGHRPPETACSRTLRGPLIHNAFGPAALSRRRSIDWRCESTSLFYG